MWAARAKRRPLLRRRDLVIGLDHGNDPDSSYDLISNDPNPAHPSLKWGEVTPSGFALRSFGPPGPNVPVTVTVP
jgi:hypothetical protein